ncbi:hypothetical protein CERZMDRAFT_101574 [Cercospora zeae-maydis SCOH1-5]|uniref:Uncharacterized protein n=1 Tax=Cercospora zeae-maydis SCOH1-5 TaxID=717836 RepID=A0A6A6F564_9PEZI|nr:hypothetical protein CERZMDRAFT_101574 [Cercospora zeae-maydis SCOH1-5]
MTTPNLIKVQTPGQRTQPKQPKGEEKSSSFGDSKSAERLLSPKRAKRPGQQDSSKCVGAKSPEPLLSPQRAKRPQSASPLHLGSHTRTTSDPTPTRGILKASRQEEIFHPGMFSPGFEREHGDKIRRNLWLRNKQNTKEEGSS